MALARWPTRVAVGTRRRRCRVHRDPTDLHAAQVVAAANAGKHVLCEKPMATTLDEAQAMIDAADRAGVVFNVGHSHSYDEPYRAMRELIASGELGRARLMHNLYYSDWVYRPRRPEESTNTRRRNHVPPRCASIRHLASAGRRTREERARANVRLGPQRPVIGAHSVFLTFEDARSRRRSTTVTARSCPRRSPTTRGSRLSADRRARFDARGVKGRDGRIRSAAQGQARRHAAEAQLAPNQPFFRLDDRELRGRRYPAVSDRFVRVYRTRARRAPLRLDRTTRDPVIEEFVDTIAGSRRALHDGRWARANLEVCVATIESGRTGREIALAHQVAVRGARSTATPRDDRETGRHDHEGDRERGVHFDQSERKRGIL